MFLYNLPVYNTINCATRKPKNKPTHINNNGGFKKHRTLRATRRLSSQNYK